MICVVHRMKYMASCLLATVGGTSAWNVVVFVLSVLLCPGYPLTLLSTAEFLLSETITFNSIWW